MEAAVVSAAVSATLKIVGNKLAPVFIKKYSSIVGVEKDLQELQDLAKEINCWLQRAGDKAIGDDPSFKWLKKLKDVAYDVDDVVDEFQLEAEKHDTYGEGGILSKYMSRWKAAKKIEKITKRFAAIVKQRTDLSPITNSIPGSQSVQHMNQTSVEMTWSIVDVSKVLGRDQYKDKIINRMVETKDQQDIEILSIVGLGGSGKTTLAKLVFRDRDIIEKHFEVRLWVHVSQEFDVKKLVEKLFEAVTNDTSNRHPFPHMSETILKELTGKRFLLVLDDVWIEDRIQWDQFREKFMVHLKDGAPISKILLTTRSGTVAKVVESKERFNLPLLSPDDSWQLFTHTFRGDVPCDFKEVGKEIVKKCGGVPLAIKALACVLRDKELKEEWESIRDNSLLDVGGAEKQISSCLRLSYVHMPSHLKPCFTICSLFPKGYMIDKEKLIDQWIAHDMVAKEAGVDDLEYTAEKYFNSLVQMSFLQDVGENYGRRVECRMHDLVHDLARSILDDNISLVPNEDCRYFSLTVQTINLPPKNLFRKARAIYVDKGYRVVNFGKALKKARHLRSVTVDSSYRTMTTSILMIKNLKYLEISTFFCKEIPEAISDIWSLQALHLTCRDLVELPKSIGKLQKLRTLNLSQCEQLKCLPDSIGDCQMLSSIDITGCKNLIELSNSIGRNKRLRVLRLGNTKIERLPSSITTLRNLECLDLQGCWALVELPAGIGNLEKLQVLNLQYCEGLGGMPVGIGQLSRLQKLELFVVGVGEKSARISELANICRNSEYLCIKGIAHAMDPDDAHRASLKQKTNLQGLDLQWMTNRYGLDLVNTDLVQAVLDGLEPPSGLKELKIGGYSGRQYARWMQDQVGGVGRQGLPLAYYPFLRVMKLDHFWNLKHLCGLAELPCLEELELRGMPSLESISGGPFPSLVKLIMEEMPSLGEVWMVVERTNTPDREEGGGCSNCTPPLGRVLRVGNSVSNLSISSCPKLKVKPYLPSSIQYLRLNSMQLLQYDAGKVKELKIDGYSGRQYAGWMQDQVGGGVQGLPQVYFPFLRVMKLYDFPNLKHLCGLAELPCLEELELREMPSLESISGGPFPSLVRLIMRGLPSLGEVWMVAERINTPDGEEGGGCSIRTPPLGQVLQVGNCLSRLSISGCPELKVKPYLPSLIQDLCLDSSNERLLQVPCQYLWLNRRSERLLQSPCQCQRSSSFSQLKKLELHGMRRSGYGRGWELLQHMKALESLEIYRCNVLITELPENMRSLTSLRSLKVASCPSIRELPESLGELRALQELTIEGCNALEQLPECLGELRSLRTLKITRLPRLTCLPQSMCGLTSLEYLHISHCLGIASLPEWIGCLTALQRLWIDGCPVLARRCEREKGEDWHLISHIPRIRIYSRFLEDLIF